MVVFEEPVKEVELGNIARFRDEGQALMRFMADVINYTDISQISLSISDGQGWNSLVVGKNTTGDVDLVFRIEANPATNYYSRYLKTTKSKIGWPIDTLTSTARSKFLKTAAKGYFAGLNPAKLAGLALLLGLSPLHSSRFAHKLAPLMSAKVKGDLVTDIDVATMLNLEKFWY